MRRPGNASRAFCESRVTSFISTVLSQFYKVNITPAAENVKEMILCRITKNGPNRAAKVCFMFKRCHYSSEVQCGQRVALSSTSLKQCGQRRGSFAGSSGFLGVILFIALITIKIAQAWIMKLMMLLMNEP